MIFPQILATSRAEEHAMGRKPKTESTPAEQQSSVAIVKNFYLTLLRKCRSAQAAMDGEKASLGGMISDAVENHRLHKGAFGWARKMEKMDAVKRGEFLFHFDVMRRYSAWDVPDMLPDRQPQDEPTSSEVVEAVADGLTDAIKKAFDDDARDLRPRHLRIGSSDPDPALKH
jgi:hypothetical protein